MSRNFVYAPMLMLFAAAATSTAGDAIQVYKFGFEDAGGPIELELNSDTMGFGLDDLAVGDSRTTVSEDGQQLTVTRMATTYAFDVAGQRFEIPARSHNDMGHCSGSPGEECRIEVYGDHLTMPAMAGGLHSGHGNLSGGLTILSPDTLDEATQSAIRSALLSAGVNDDVRFIAPGSSGDGAHKVVVIEKNVVGDGEDVTIEVRKHIMTDE